jgi:hypothetical protein
MELHVLHRHGWSIAALTRELRLNWWVANRYATAAKAPTSTNAGRGRTSGCGRHR